MPTNKLFEVLGAVETAKEDLRQMEDERDKFLQPILVVLGATGGGIDYASVSDGELHVTRVGSTRGCGWSDDYTFPASIFTAEDPIAEAHKYVAQKKEAEAEAKRRSKMAELQRLQKERGISA